VENYIVSIGRKQHPYHYGVDFCFQSYQYMTSICLIYSQTFK